MGLVIGSEAEYDNSRLGYVCGDAFILEMILWMEAPRAVDVSGACLVPRKNHTYPSKAPFGLDLKSRLGNGVCHGGGCMSGQHQGGRKLKDHKSSGSVVEMIMLSKQSHRWSLYEVQTNE